MKKAWSTALALSVIFSLGITSCNNDDDDDNDDTSVDCSSNAPTYAGGVNTIIQQNCAFSGCHGAGSPNGVFEDYAGLEPYLNSGSFYNRVLVQQDMPPSGNLSTSDLETLECWSQNGYAP